MDIALKIVIVEDNDCLRKEITDKIVYHFPHDEVFSFESGEAAAESIRKSPVDIAVLDIHLPGVNGLKIANLIRTACPEALIIIYTNYDFPEYQEHSMASGADHFLSKEEKSPGDIVQLIKNTAG